MDNKIFSYLGIDTSNYTTSAALLSSDEKVVCDARVLLEVADGARGLRQSDAVFAHVKNLPVVMDKIAAALSDTGEGEIIAVGYSSAPRGIDGSYMPCFLPGVAAAHAAAAAAGVPAYAFSHQGGHIAAALYSAGKLSLLDSEEKFAAFHVSGGTTDVLLVTPCGGADFTIERIGGTLDLNAGQLVDRVGVMMGLHFPCGPELEKIASSRRIGEYNRKPNVNGLSVNLSGAENIAETLWKKTGDDALVAAFVLDFIGASLDEITKNLRREYGPINIIYAGGVMSCARIRETLKKHENVYFAGHGYSSDNAVGTAVLCKLRHEAEMKKVRQDNHGHEFKRNP